MERTLGNLFDNDGWIPLYVITRGRCRNCQKAANAYCSNCFYAYYCCRECQVRDYVNHKIVCSEELKMKIIDYEFAHINNKDYKAIIDGINKKFSQKFGPIDLFDDIKVIMPRSTYLGVKALERQFWKMLMVPDKEILKIKKKEEAVRYYGIRALAEIKKTELVETMRLFGIYEEEMEEFIRKYRAGEIVYKVLDYNIYKIKELIKAILKQHILGSEGGVPCNDITAKTNLFHCGHACLFFSRVIPKFYNQTPEIISCYRVFSNGTYHPHMHVMLEGHSFDIWLEIEMELAGCAQEIRNLRNHTLEIAEPTNGVKTLGELEDIYTNFALLAGKLENKSNSFIALAEVWHIICGMSEEILVELKDRHKKVEMDIIDGSNYLLEKKEYPPKYADKIA